MKNFWLIAAILFAPHAVAQVSKAPVLICTPISQVTVSESGEAVVGKPTGLFRDKILIDLESGIVRQPPSGNARSLWRIVQKGDIQNDWILIGFNRSLPLDAALAGATRGFLAVQARDKSKPITFFEKFLDSQWSGTCEPIK